MPNQSRNGSRNVAVPDENRPTWRPTDEYGLRNRRNMNEDDERYMRDRDEDDRYMQRERFSHWDDRRVRDGRYRRDDDRDDRTRNVDYSRSYDARGFERFERDGRYSDPDRMSGQHQEGGMYGHGPGSWNDPQPRRSHRGKGPIGYLRSDERIREAVCEALTDDHDVDASHIEITVKNGEVILAGTVEDRRQKRMAEDCAEQVFGVKDVQNQIRVRDRNSDDRA